MILQVHPSHVRAVGTPEELQALHEELTYDLGKRRGRAERMCLYDPMSRIFPVGLLVEAEAALRSRGVGTARNDLRSFPARRAADLGWLLPHQLAAVEAAIRARVGCIDVPTAGGKGEIIAGLCISLPDRGLVLCDDIGGVHQLGDPVRFFPGSAGGANREKSGRIALRMYQGNCEEPIGMVGDGQWQGDRRVVVASPATIDQQFDGNRWSQRAQELLGRVEWVLYDEVQMSGSPRSQRILRAMTICSTRIGLSATVGGRSDNRDAAVRAQFGPIVYRVPRAELESQGIIAEQRVIMIRCDQPNISHYSSDGYQRGISLSKARNALVAEIWRRRRTGILTFVRDIDHGRYLLKISEAIGIRSEFVWGDDSSDERKAAIARFERGEVANLICSKIFKQNTDIIHAYTCINAAGGKSCIEAVQRGGRGGRICRAAECRRCAEMGRKAAVLLCDFYDEDSKAEEAKRRRLTLPGQWLRRHSEGRRRAYEDKGMRVEVVGIGEV